MTTARQEKQRRAGGEGVAVIWFLAYIGSIVAAQPPLDLEAV